MITTAGSLKLHIFGKIIDIKNANRNYYQEQLSGVKAIGHTAGDILEIEGNYYAVNSNLELEPIDGEHEGEFYISFNVTKNIMDFRNTFKDILKSWDSCMTIHQISIRPDDTFIVEQFGKAFESDVHVTYMNNGEAGQNFIILTKKVRTISSKSRKYYMFDDIWVSVRVYITYDLEDKIDFKHINLRLSEYKKKEIYGELSPYDYVIDKFNPPDYNYISQAEKNGYGYVDWFNSPSRYYLIGHTKVSEN